MNSIFFSFIFELELGIYSFKGCCYIILRDSHYESLNLRIGNNSNGKRSNFDSNDEE
ncbi:unnamed protein product, partial [Rotaria sp. Silwood2]